MLQEHMIASFYYQNKHYSSYFQAFAQGYLLSRKPFFLQLPDKSYINPSRISLHPLLLSFLRSS